MYFDLTEHLFSFFQENPLVCFKIEYSIWLEQLVKLI